MPRRRAFFLIGRFTAAAGHVEHRDFASELPGGNPMKRPALLCTGEKNKQGRDHQHQRTDDQQQYFGSAPPFGGLRRRLIRLIVTHARSTIETYSYHELVRRHRQDQRQDDTSRNSPASSRLNSRHHAHQCPVRNVLVITAGHLCQGPVHRLLGGLCGDLLLRLTEGCNRSV